MFIGKVSYVHRENKLTGSQNHVFMDDFADYPSPDFLFREKFMRLFCDIIFTQHNKFNISPMNLSER